MSQVSAVGDRPRRRPAGSLRPQGRLARRRTVIPNSAQQVDTEFDDDPGWEPPEPPGPYPVPPPGLVPATHTPPPMVPDGIRPLPLELAAEQAYFDHVDRHRERMKSQADAPAAAANRGAAARLRAWAQRRKEHMGAADQAVAIGRIDDDEGQILYVGRETIFDEAADVLVVNWRAPAAAPFYEASPADPQGIVRKRTYECAGNTV